MSELPQADFGPNSEAADEWLSAPETYGRIINTTMSRTANLAIAQRAHAGLLRAQAQMFTDGDRTKQDATIPKEFWWADGHEALEQNWQTGDFETWIDRRIHLRALGVSFHLGDLRKCFPDIFKAEETKAPPSEVVAGKAGRLPAEWWDDLWIEMCRRLYVGDLQPKKQADIETAMEEWIVATGQTASTSTIRGRARKLWHALEEEDKN